MGRDYDACVISAGFVGLGLGATLVAIANMDAVTTRFGPSQKAFLVVPLVGAFFVDIPSSSRASSAPSPAGWCERRGHGQRIYGAPPFD